MRCLPGTGRWAQGLSSRHSSALSPRYGTTRRCSSLGSLPLDRASTSSQLQPAQGSRPPSQHRSISAWASSITVPRPFRMTLREARKKAQRLASPTSFEQGRRQGQEEAECQRQFRAQPVPAHVYLPLYQELVARSEARRQAGIQERKELLLSSLKPFSFLQKEEQRKEAARHQDTAATAKAKATKQKVARRIPKSILEPALGDKLQGKTARHCGLGEPGLETGSSCRPMRGCMLRAGCGRRLRRGVNSGEPCAVRAVGKPTALPPCLPVTFSGDSAGARTK